MTRKLLAIVTLSLTACAAEPLPSPPAPYDRATDGFPTIGDNRFTPLGRSILDNDLDGARRLLEGGADPNVRSGSKGDYHPLTIALLSYSGYGPRSPARKTEFVRLLLQHGADPNARWCPFESRGNGDEKWWTTCRSAVGTTGLIEAAGFDWVEIVDLLLAAGADPRLRDWHEGTALDYASDEHIIHAIGRVLFPAEAGRNARILALMNEHGGGWFSLNTTRLERALSPTWPPNASPRLLPPPGENDYRKQADLDDTARIVSHVGAILRLGADPNERVTAGGGLAAAGARDLGQPCPSGEVAAELRCRSQPSLVRATAVEGGVVKEGKGRRLHGGHRLHSNDLGGARECPRRCVNPACLRSGFDPEGLDRTRGGRLCDDRRDASPDDAVR